MDSARIVTQSPSDISPEQARDARARAWAFVFQCWQAKKMAAEPTPQPDGRDGTTLVRITKEVVHVEQRPGRPSQNT
jgi:hypothetical protein